MKKMIIGIIIGIIVTLVIVTVTILVYTKFFMFVPDKDGMINPNVDQKEQISVGEDVKFGGHTSSAIQGKRLNISDDVGKQLDDEQHENLKKLISGDEITIVQNPESER